MQDKSNEMTIFGLNGVNFKLWEIPKSMGKCHLVQTELSNMNWWYRIEVFIDNVIVGSESNEGGEDEKDIYGALYRTHTIWFK